MGLPEDQARVILREELVALLDPEADRSVRTQPTDGTDRPAVILVVGVNGTGKTTTIGKLAWHLTQRSEDVV